MDRSAKWIWPRTRRHQPDLYMLARREFTLPATPEKARLEITACERYRLVVNGKTVGEGPLRSQWPDIYSDVYELDDLPLVRGKNVIAVIAHNTALAQHGRPSGPGGLLAHLAVTCRNGSKVTVPTSTAWRMIEAPQYVTPAPRRLFTVGFAEICDLRREPDGWTEPGFDDRPWPEAQVVASQPAQPYTRIGPCPIPPLVVEPTAPAGVGACGTTGSTRGITGLPFEFCVFCKCDEEFYGASFVYSPRRQKATLSFAADNRATVFLNNHRVLCQPPVGDRFFNHLQDELDTYTGLYWGHGHRVSGATVQLEKGWNSLGVVLGAPHDTWGFVLRLADPKTGRTLPLRFSSDRADEGVPAWQVISDTHLADGEDGMLLEMPPLNEGTFPSPAHLAAWEPRRKTKVDGADVLCDGGARDTLSLPPGAFVTYRMPAELVGTIELEVRGEAGAVLDITAGEVLRKDGCIESVRGGDLYLTDRLILSGKWTTWRSFDRRGMRYIELAARNASQPVEVRRLRVRASHYVPPAPAEFETNDKVFNRLWDVGLATLDACTQEQMEDCPIREQAQWLGDTVVEGQVAAAAWGDQALTAKALRQYADDQPVEGWIRPMVPSGYGDTLTDYALMLPQMLWRHWMHWGDEPVLRDCFAGITRLMNYAATLVDADGFIVADEYPRNMVLLDHTVSKRTHEFDVITGYQAVYAIGLERAAQVAEAIGQKTKAKRWRRQREKIAAAVGRLFNAERGLFADGMTDGQLDPRVTATTNYWMLLADLATPEQERRILETLWSEPTREPEDLWPRGETPYFKFFVLEALCRRGLWREAFAVIRNYYGPMLRRKDAWTLFEVWDPKTPPRQAPRSNSLCHAWGAGPLAHYFRWICGLRPLEPGFKRMIVEPMPGDLKRLDASMHTPRGRVGLEMTTARNKRRIVVTVPSGIEAELSSARLGPGDRLELA